MDVTPADALENSELYSDAIVMGSLLDNEADRPEKQAAVMAVNQINAAGGLDGHAVVLFSCSYEESDVDERDSETAVVAMARHLTETVGALAVVGPATSSLTQLAYEVFEENQTLLISPSATSPSLTPIDGLVHSDESPGLLWRTIGPDTVQAYAISEDMITRGVTGVAVVYESGAYGEGLAETFMESFSQEEGAEVSAHLFLDETGLNTAITDVAGLPSEQFQEVLFVASELSTISEFLNTAALLDGFLDKKLFLPDAAAEADLFSATSEAAALYPSIRGTRPAVPSGVLYDVFKAYYAAAFAGEDAEDSVYTAHSYDAAWLAIYALTWALFQEEDLSGFSLARGLRRVSEGDEIQIRPTDWPALKAHFKEGQSVNIVGASGLLDFDPETEETTGPIDVWEISGDENPEFSVLYTYEPVQEP